MSSPDKTSKEGLIEIVSHRKGAVRFVFANGNEVSIVFGPGTYSDNYDLAFETRLDGTTIYKSTTVEIMLDGPDAEAFEEIHDGNPAARVPVSEVPNVLAWAKHPLKELPNDQG